MTGREKKGREGKGEEGEGRGGKGGEGYGRGRGREGRGRTEGRVRKEGKKKRGGHRGRETLDSPPPANSSGSAPGSHIAYYLEIFTPLVRESPIWIDAS
jgi:hypothetical protein